MCLCVYLQTPSCTLPTLSELSSVQPFLLFGLCSVGEANHLLFVTSSNAWGGLSHFIFQQGSKEQWVVMGKLPFCKVEHCPFLRVQLRWSLVAL